MRGVDRRTDEEIDIGRLFQKQPRYTRSAVLLDAPIRINAVRLAVAVGIFQHAAHGDDALGDQIDALDLRDGRDVGVEVVELRFHRLA